MKYNLLENILLFIVMLAILVILTTIVVYTLNTCTTDDCYLRESGKQPEPPNWLSWKLVLFGVVVSALVLAFLVTFIFPRDTQNKIIRR